MADPGLVAGGEGDIGPEREGCGLLRARGWLDR